MMADRTLPVVIVLAAIAAWIPWARQNQTRQPMGSGQMTIPMSADSLPEECRTAVQAGGQSQMRQGMDMQGAPQDMMANMTEAQKANVEAMTRMLGPIMIGIMTKDADVAFVCGMIPHHRGAIDMAQVALRTGDNLEARTFAERVIRDQGLEITEMKEWLQKYAKTEGNP